MSKLCIYHGGCADGFGAAYSVWKKYADVSEVAKKYGGGGHKNAAGFKVDLP